MQRNLDIVILGLSITSSWGNGHATTFRHLVRALLERGHRVLFLERDVPWYAEHRDLAPNRNHGEICLYDSLEQLRDQYRREVAHADLVIVGSYVPDGIEVGEWVLETADGVRAFYDIDTPVTLDALADDRSHYLNKALVPRYDLYLSFSGGRALELLERQFGSPCARPLYCSVDTERYYPQPAEWRYDLGYMGTYSADRQPGLNELLLTPARRSSERRFVVAGPQYPPTIDWPGNVQRIEHLSPEQHCDFYNRQRYTLNLTRSEMKRLGYSPSIRLFEAAACGTAIVSDCWPGLDDFFQIGSEIVVADSAVEVIEVLQSTSDEQIRQLGERARQRVLQHHTGDHRARELEQYFEEVTVRRSAPAAPKFSDALT